MREALAGTKTAMTEDEMKAALQQLRTEFTDRAGSQGQGSRSHQPQRRRHLPRREQVEGRRQGSPRRPAIQGPDRGQRPQARSDRHGHRQLSRYPDQRQGIRQLVQARSARKFPRQRRDQGMDRSAAVDARRIEVSALHSRRSRLRRSRRRSRHRPRRHPDLRSGIALHRRARRSPEHRSKKSEQK